MRRLRDQRAPAYAAVVALSVAGTLLFTDEIATHGGSVGPQEAVAISGGIPVGTRRTPDGALAAADNYLAVASQSIEQTPRVFAALVAQTYEPAGRAGVLAEARRLRAGDTANMTNYAAGGEGVAVIAARRLDRYTPASATVTTWLGGFVWGPRYTPRQTWNLVDTTLAWKAGRWLIVSSKRDSTPAPVPALVYVDGTNDRSSAFGRLAGMSAPFYGAGG